MNNLAANPAYTEVKSRLAQQLMRTLTAAGDPRVTASPVPFEHPPYTDAAADTRSTRKADRRKAQD